MKFVGCYDSKGSSKNLRQSVVPFKTLNFSAKNVDMDEFKDFEHLFELDSPDERDWLLQLTRNSCYIQNKKEQKKNDKRDLSELGHKEPWN